MVSVGAQSLVERHLGTDPRVCGLRDAQEFRSVVVTSHRVGSSVWEWQGGLGAPLTHSLVLFPTDGVGVQLNGSELNARAVGAFLPAHAESRVEWRSRGEVLGVWVPADTLSDLSVPFQSRSVALGDARLTLAMRAFAQSVARGSRTDSSISAYAIEHLIAEMAFAMLLELQGLDTLDDNSIPVTERARALMLARREDPEFTSAAIAAELHLSRRQVQRAFAATGTTPAAELRRLRIQLAVTMLRDPQYAPLTAVEIARHSGFRNTLQLRRALEAEGMPGPRTIRDEAASEG